MADPRPEPSMEEILASIKRIIADEPALTPRPPAPASERDVGPRPVSPAPRAPSEGAGMSAGTSIPWPPRAEARSVDPILELTSRMSEPAVPSPVEPPPGVQSPPAPASVRTPPTPTAAPPGPTAAAPATSRRDEASVGQAAPRPVPADLLPRTPTPRPRSSEITVEALVRELLQPMLSEWLDRNLPEIVERAVQAEIRRISESG